MKKKTKENEKKKKKKIRHFEFFSSSHSKVKTFRNFPRLRYVKWLMVKSLTCRFSRIK